MKKNSKKRNKIIGTIAAIVSIIGVIWAIFFQGNSNNSNSYGDQSPVITNAKGDIKIEYNNYSQNDYKGINYSATNYSNEHKEEVKYIKYSTTKSKNQLYSSLTAEIDGQTYILIDDKEEYCLNIIEQKDFDNNNSIDVLVEHITACGGNCCANSYFFYTYIGDGHFIKTDEFGYSWNDPIIEKWKGYWSVYVTSENEGVNNNPPVEKKERFILDGYMIVKVEESKRMSIKTEVELTSDKFDYNKKDETLKLLYDLNFDDTNDTIIASFWPRWGRMFWEIHFSDKKIYKSGIGAKRLGILKTSSLGCLDLVIDQDLVLKWNGKEYK